MPPAHVAKQTTLRPKYLKVTHDMVCQKAFGGSGNENAQCIQTTSDGGIILAGQAGSNNGDISGYHGEGDAWIIKLKP